MPYESIPTVPRFALFLFGSNPATVREATAAGMDGFVIDWERGGKLDARPVPTRRSGRMTRPTSRHLVPLAPDSLPCGRAGSRLR